MTKENWIILLCIGLLLMIVAVPSGKNSGEDGGLERSRMGSQVENQNRNQDESQDKNQNGNRMEEEEVQAAAKGISEKVSSGYTYEALLEKRVKEVLAHVEGVGKVDVLIILKSSEQKVYQTDGKSSQSATKEQDSAGGTRDITEQQKESSTVLVNGSGEEAPLVEKELRPELSGIVISAQGGGNPVIKAEITGAMEALFDLPAHRIKVLKRVE
ncbi:MAG: stage III sporulation protein AG [Lachnospiraceae bacterium]|nr:stage III sporulation protein AG [Lachnospiraceae bacterium]